MAVEGQEGTSQEVVLELRLEDEAESSGWGWVRRDRASHREVHEQQAQRFQGRGRQCSQATRRRQGCSRMQRHESRGLYRIL